MEPFRSSVTPFGANPMPSGQAPIAGIDNPRIAAILQHLQTLPPDQIAKLRDTILNTPENQRGAALSQFFTSSGNPQAAQAVADVEQQRVANGGVVPGMQAGPSSKYSGQPAMDPSRLPPGAVNMTAGTPVGVPNPRPEGGPTPAPGTGSGTTSGGGTTPGGGATPGPLQNFDFTPLKDRVGKGAYADPSFVNAWAEVKKRLQALTPEQHKLVNEHFASLNIQPGEARGLNGWIDSYNKVMGQQPSMPETNPPPPGGDTNPPPPGGDTNPPPNAGPSAGQQDPNAARLAARAQATAARMGSVNNFDWGGVPTADRTMPWEDFKKKYFGGLGRGRAGGAAFKAWSGQQTGGWGGGTTANTPDAGQTTSRPPRTGAAGRIRDRNSL